MKGGENGSKRRNRNRIEMWRASASIVGR